MKRLISLMLFLAMILSLVSCGDTALEIDDGKIVASWKVPEAFNRLDEAFPDYKVRGYENNPIKDFEFDAYYYICTLPTSERVYIYNFATEEQAQKHASNYSADGSGYSWTGLVGQDHGMVIDYEQLPVHFWLCEDCVVEYGGNDEIAVKLTELFGEQFAGDELIVEIPDDDESDKEYIGPQPIADLAKMLDENGIYLETVKDDSDYSFNSFEHIPEAYYIITLTNCESVYIRVYDSADTAAAEASNYGSDGSKYTPKNGVTDEDGNMMVEMIIDYIAPVHFWLSGECIIEYCSFDNEIAWMLQGYLGEQFAGMPIEAGETDEDIDFTAQYIRTGIHNFDEYFSSAVIFRSRSELDGYIEENINSFDLGHSEAEYMDTTIGFADAIEGYTDEWFENGNALIVLRILEPSCSITHKISRVHKRRNGTLVAEGARVTDYGDEAIEFWHIILEVGAEDIQDLAEDDIEVLISDYASDKAN